MDLVVLEVEELEDVVEEVVAEDAVEEEEEAVQVYQNL
jgi:hypothetical protein